MLRTRNAKHSRVNMQKSIQNQALHRTIPVSSIDFFSEAPTVRAIVDFKSQIGRDFSVRTTAQTQATEEERS